MTDKYDCTDDVMEHRSKVAYWMHALADQIEGRAKHHDNSKLKDPIEKALFDHWTPELRRLTFGTDEYKQALDGMGEGVQRHYRANRHHPEHYANGVNDMTLVDVIEMLCDWMAAAQAKGTHVDLNHAAQRFGLSDQLVRLMINQLREEDAWGETNGYNCGLCPPEEYNKPVEGLHRKDGGKDWSTLIHDRTP